MDRGWLLAGRVGSPHGLDGSFHVGDPRPQLLTLGGTVAVQGQTLRITRRAGTDQRVILRLEGHDDRSAAQALRGEELLVARTEAPELEPDEWWAEDLEGCNVHDAGRPVGTVRRLLALPSCEVLEVERPGEQADLLVPLVTDAVRSVDVERREVEIDLEFLGER
jgi:16S rRNA processing protein RimM